MHDSKFLSEGPFVTPTPTGPTRCGGGCYATVLGKPLSYSIAMCKCASCQANLTKLHVQNH